MKRASMVVTIRVRPWARHGRRVALVPLKKPSAGERRSWKALRRLLLNLAYDLGCCSCAPGDPCPACELKEALS